MSAIGTVTGRRSGTDVDALVAEGLLSDDRRYELCKLTCPRTVEGEYDLPIAACAHR